MTKEEYTRKMAEHEESFQKLWEEIVKDSHYYIGAHPYGPKGHLTPVAEFAETLMFCGTWVYDRAVEPNRRAKKTLRQKIRKILGYAYP